MSDPNVKKSENSSPRTETGVVSENDVIYRQAAIDAVIKRDANCGIDSAEVLKLLPSAQPEPLTDKEQRIFLAAMGREMKVCEEVDRYYTIEPYEDSLVRVCREIERKVKGALWT